MKSSLVAALLIIGLHHSFGSRAWAAAEGEDIPLSAGEKTEIKEILDGIKSANPPQHGMVRFRGGMMQLLNNVPSNLNLGQDNTIPASGIETYYNFWQALGLEMHYIYARNVLRPDNSSAQMDFFNIGPRYTFYLDETQKANYFALKAFYHQSTNNVGTKNNLLINKYTGYALSIERSIPASTKTGVIASLDLLRTTSAYSANPSESFSQWGTGFTIRGEIYYQLNVLGSSPRLGVSYWQQSYSNEVGFNPDGVSGGIRNQFFRNSYFQVSRAIWGTVSFVY